MNLTDFSTPSLYYYYRKRIGTTSENLNFDIRVKKDNLKKRAEAGNAKYGRQEICIPLSSPPKIIKLSCACYAGKNI